MILVTGSNSFLGKKLVEQLIKDGQKIRCLDIEKPKDLPKDAAFFKGDVLDDDILKKVCDGVDTIFHLMAIKDPKYIGRRHMKKVNIKGTGNILSIAQKAEVKKFFFLSSYEIYGRTKKIPTRQDDRKKPITSYGKDMLKAEKICWDYDKSGTMAITIFRPALVIGPGVDNPVILITLLMALGMGDANRLYISGNGDTKFQLLHPDDAVDAFMKAYKSDVSKGKVYNLGSDNVQTQMELLVHIKDMAKLDCTIKHLSPSYTKFLSVILKPFKINYLNKEHLLFLLNSIILDCQRAKSDLNWEPKKDNIHILLETIAWYKNEKL